jgi:hypothetical protein
MDFLGRLSGDGQIDGLTLFNPAPTWLITAEFAMAGCWGVKAVA